MRTLSQEANDQPKFNGVLVTLCLVLAACQTSPTGRSQLIIMPADQMDSMGVQAFDDMKAKQSIEYGTHVNTYVRCVANAITEVLPERRDWEVVVFRDETANAFALPGGKIGVHTGLLKVAVTAGQLAAVLGHEVGHVLAQHGNERVSEAFAIQGGLALAQESLSRKSGGNYSTLMAALGLGAQFGVLLPHSRTQESESDLIGLDLMAKAGFDPRQSIELWQNMEKSGGGQPPEFLSTHPSHETRIDDLRSHMRKAMGTYESSGDRPNCIY